MKTLEELLGRKALPKSEIFNPKLNNLIFDWFKTSTSDLQDFIEYFLKPAQEIGLDLFGNWRKPENNYQVEFQVCGVLYLARKAPNISLFARFFELIRLNKLNAYEVRNNFFKHNYFKTIQETSEIHNVLHDGRDILKLYHAIHPRDDANISYLSGSISGFFSSKYRADKSSFLWFLDWLDKQQFVENPLF